MPPAIRLHDLRHTHATLYLRAGRVPEDRQRAPGARHHLDHPGRLPARAADAAARGRCPGGRPHLRRLTGARYHRIITNPGSGYLADLADLAEPPICSNVAETTC